MAYLTGTAVSPTDLLQKLVTFLTNNGWTQDMSQADGAGWRAHLHKGTLYINLRASHNEAGIWSAQNANAYTLNCYTGTGFSAASNWRSQAGGPIGNGTSNTVGCTMNLGLATVTYHFFQDATDNVVVVVERTAGWFVYSGWGSSLTKVGSWTGGTYCFGSNQMENQASLDRSNSIASSVCPMNHGGSAYGGTGGQGGLSTDRAFVRCDVDSFTGKYLAVGADATFWQRGYTGKLAFSALPTVNSNGDETSDYWSSGLDIQFPHYAAYSYFNTINKGVHRRTTSAFNGRANMLPILLFAQRDAGGFSLIGHAPTVLFCNGVGNGFAAGQLYTVGPDNYRLFPNFAVKQV